MEKVDEEEGTPPVETSLLRSPSIKKTMVEHKIHLEDQKDDDTWDSCCLRVDRRAVMYFGQLSVILISMLFSMYQLIKISECSGQQAYLGLLTMLIGILAPTPSYSKK